MPDPRIDAFLAYITQRGIPERYHNLYRDELLSVLLHAGVASLGQLQAEHLQEAVLAAERQLQNRKAVCAALDEYLRVMHLPATQTARRGEAVPDSARGSVAFPAPDPNEGRRYVRVPFNREVRVEGSLAPIRASDLSLGGMYLETPQAIELGEVLNLTFTLHSGDPHPITVQAEVVYVDPRVGVGTHFLDLPPEEAREIRHFIEEVVASRRR